jgi:RNA polymerase sigma factor (sigma-70 family)
MFQGAGQAQLGARVDQGAQLLQAVASGDEFALRTFYERYGPLVLSYLVGRLGNRQWAEEVLQDVMVGVWKGARGFRGESQVMTWVLAIARRQAMQAQRRRRLDTIELDEELAGPAPESPGELADVRAALRLLPPDQRETLELIFYYGLTGREAALVLDVAEGTVKSRLHRAKALLRDLLERDEDHHG